MIRLRNTVFILSFSILSCGPNQTDGRAIDSEKPSEDVLLPQENGQFEGYLKKFEKSDLPIVIKGCAPNTLQLAKLKDEMVESFPQKNDLAYRQIPSNGNFISTISLGMADCYLPILTTYKLTGEKIDQKTIAIGYCGSDCGYSCSEFMKIENDYSIFVSDTISSAECDEFGIIPGTTKNFVIFKTGKVLENGKIELSEEVRTDLDSTQTLENSYPDSIQNIINQIAIDKKLLRYEAEEVYMMQKGKDPDLLKMLQEDKDFSQMSIVGLPSEYRPYFYSIKETLVQKDLKFYDFWMKLPDIKEYETTISIPIYHYDGFVFQKKLDEENLRSEQNPNENGDWQIIDIDGNLSGFDGVLEIEKSTKKVLSYSVWN